MPAASADVESGDNVWIGPKQGYGGTGLFSIYLDTPADPADLGDADYYAYCIEHAVSAQTGLHGEVGDLADYLGDNRFTDPGVLGKVLWVLAHSYPALSIEEFGAAAGVPGIASEDAIEATQFAIWRYTELTWDASWPWENSDSEAAYWYLVNGANANPGMTLADFEVTVSVDAPTTPQTADSLVGPFVVHTNQPAASITVDPAAIATDAAGDPIDTDAVTDGQEVYLDQRGSTSAGSAVVTASAQGAGSTGKIISVPETPGDTATASHHAQTIILVVPSTKGTSDRASIQWSATATPAPVIGTSLVDAADNDQVLAWNGGTAIDTVAYQNLTPGTEYTVTGELINKADGTPTGIIGSETFTPSTANGSVDITFTVSAGHAGEVLVAFEELFEGNSTSPVAEHRDINDPAQTVTIEDAPATSGSGDPDDTSYEGATDTGSTDSGPDTSHQGADDTTGSADPGDHAPPHGALPATGSSVGPGLLLAAVLSVAAGVALLLRNSRRKHLAA